MERTPLPPKPSRPISGHSAFRSVWFPIGWLRHSTQGVLEESHQPRRLASRSPVSRRPTVCPHAPTWNGLRCTGCLALRHFAGPFEMSDSRELTPHSYPPWLHDHYSLHRYYGGSDPDRPFFRRQPWFPDSRHLNFQPCCLQSSAVSARRYPLPPRVQLILFGLRHYMAGSPEPPTESSSQCNALLASLRYGLVVLFPLLSTRGYSPEAVTFGYWPSVSAKSGTFTLPFRCALSRTMPRLRRLTKTCHARK
jgi:hypothetical protein